MAYDIGVDEKRKVCLIMKVAVVLGTRPEAIKLCPVILAMKADPFFDCRVISTGQHKEMLDQVLEVFDVEPDYDFHLMRPNQTLASLTARAVEALDVCFAEEKPDAVMVQGDTTTVLAGALSAFYRHIPVAHVEAGLRTCNLESPWPEEANRQMVTRLARWHFAPTEGNKMNLLKEGVDEKSVCVTGNTVIDALHLGLEKAKTIDVDAILGRRDTPAMNRRMVLVTGHRRENFGEGFEEICYAIAELAEKYPDVDFVYPVHLNPNVRKPVDAILAKRAEKNVFLVKPQDYLPFVALMHRAYIVLTDSGGVQEEAPSLGKPVLVMRDTTERPEAVDAGTVKLVGPHKGRIVNNVSDLLDNKDAYSKMSKAVNPYGDGLATKRILSVLSSKTDRG